VADWVTISSMATAGGTLVLAVATFSSVRSANRSARVAELSLLAGLRPVLIPSREDDPVERVRFGDDHVLQVPGHGGVTEVADGRLYFSIALRNGGSGLAVLLGWRIEPQRAAAGHSQPPLESFRRQSRDLYIPSGDTGFWQGAIREREDPDYQPVRTAVERQERITVDLLYGDEEGGQRAIARFGIGRDGDTATPRAEVVRYYNIDRPAPREAGR
jgi:hypothetical protein